MLKTRPLTNDELFDRKASELKALADKARLCKWDLVDKLLECEDLLGDRFSQAVEVTQLAPGTISNYLSTGRAWPVSLRHLDMPFDYHKALNPLPPEQKTAAMQTAKKADWDRDELRRRVAAWQAGDRLAFDYRHKVSTSEPRPRRTKPELVVVHAGVNEATAAVIPTEEFSDAPGAQAGVPQPTPTERLNHVLGLLKVMRTDPGFMAALEPQQISADACALEGQWLVNVGTETRHRQDVEFDKSPRSRASGAAGSPAPIHQPAPADAEEPDISGFLKAANRPA